METFFCTFVIHYIWHRRLTLHYSKGAQDLNSGEFEMSMIVNQLSFREHIGGMLHPGTWDSDSKL